MKMGTQGQIQIQLFNILPRFIQNYQAFLGSTKSTPAPLPPQSQLPPLIVEN